MEVMAAVGEPQEAHDLVLKGWLDCLGRLVADVQHWAGELDWSTRLISKKMKDSRLGTYSAPALIIQKETVRVLLDPIGRSAPGADGVVDLYLMPAYDDIASLYLVDDVWRMHYMFAEAPTVATMRDAESVPLSRETLGRVLDEMCRHAA
jgi:hypothetical protein